MNIRELVQRINDFYRDRHTDNVIDTDPNDLVLPGFISRNNGVFSYNGQGAEQRVLSDIEQMRLNEALRQNIILANYLRDHGLILRNQAVQDNQGQHPDNQGRHPDNNGGRGSVRNRRTKYRRSSKSSRAKRSKKMRRTRHRKRT
jgi:hypothetical protein